MKSAETPTLHPVVIVDVSCGEEFTSLSTYTSEETRDIDGVTHYVLKTEVSSASHPFYTGKQNFLDTAKRLEKFEEKQKKHADIQGTSKHRSKKEKRAARASKKNSAKADAKEALKAAKSALKDL